MEDQTILFLNLSEFLLKVSHTFQFAFAFYNVLRKYIYL